jgi:hypothetical protein
MSEERDDREEPRRDEPRREGRGPRLRGLARRILGEGDDEREAPTEDLPPEERERARREARAVLSSLWETGDKARMEIVRLIAREVRGYLEAMEIHKDLHHLITNYSLEVHASFHLKPLPEDVKGAPSEPGVRAGLKPKPREGPADEHDDG